LTIDCWLSIEIYFYRHFAEWIEWQHSYIVCASDRSPWSQCGIDCYDYIQSSMWNLIHLPTHFLTFQINWISILYLWYRCQWRNKGGDQGFGPGRGLKNSKSHAKGRKKFFKRRLILFTGSQIFDFAPGRRRPLLRHCQMPLT